MEKIDIKIPNLGEAESTEIIEVNIKPGERVSINDPLIVLESEKAAMEVPSDYEGEIKEVLIKEGDEVSEGMVFAKIEIEKKEVIHETENEANHEEKREAEINQTSEKTAYFSMNGINAGPAVRKYARELEIDLKKIEGTGNNSRITKDDLKRFIHRNTSSEKISKLPKLEDFTKYGKTEVSKLSKIQSYASQNLSNAWVSIPHVTHFEEIDITNINKIRQKIKISPLSFLVEALCQNLIRFPKFNSSLLENDEIAVKEYINIGIAVDTPDGLVVPVIKDANYLTAEQLDYEIKLLAEKAINKKLLTKDFEAATFTISSLGKIGGTGFTPIINPPEVGIIGVSKSRKQLQFKNDEIHEVDILPVSLSYDHRVINGADAGRFMNSFKELLEKYNQG